MIYVWKENALQPFGSFGSTVGRNPKLGEKQEMSCPLNSHLTLPALPSLFFTSFFSLCLSGGGWVTVNLIERQINEEIYCHFRAPPA